MAKVIYGGQSYECGENSILDCLTAHGVAVPSSCRSGVCQTCLMRVVEGKVPEKAQAGLKPTLAAQKYFMACSCYPETDIEVVLPDAALSRATAKVISVDHLNADVAVIKLKPDVALEYNAGQFINLFKDELTARCYSLASVPALDDELIIHVRHVPNGLVSGWLFSELKSGDDISISEASGECFYVAGNAQQNILLVATGTGLAPLYGIIRDALKNGHQGRLRLYHGNNTVESFYLVSALRELAKTHENFSYVACISDGEVPPSYVSGMVLDAALADNPNLAGWRIFLCGNPNMVNAAKQKTFFAGASMRDIFADPF